MTQPPREDLNRRFLHYLRLIRVSIQFRQPRPALFATFDAVRQGCQHTGSQHPGRNRRCRHRRNLWTWLLGAGVASDRERVLRCAWSVVSLSVEAGFPAFDNDVKPMVRFGLHVVGFSVIATVARAMDRIALGLFYRPDQVLLSKRDSAVRELHLLRAYAASYGRKRGPQQTSIRSGCSSEKVRSGIVCAGILPHARGGDPVRRRGRPDGDIVGREVADGRLPPEHSRPAWRFFVIEGSQGWLHLSIGRADRWRNW